MNHMFRQAAAFNQSISGWKTGRVTQAHRMFDYAAAWNAVFVHIDGSTSTDGPPSAWQLKQ